ncbi:nucleotidyltransferase domain-containing protein [archaeon]|nr:nucleotidyltransferase domain-containing protein [archaeon]
MVKKITKYKIIIHFTNDYNKKYYLRELATILKKPHQTIKPYLEELTKEKILIKIKRKNIVDYSLNFQNKKTPAYLAIAEKEKLIERLQEDTLLNTFFEKISPFFKNNTLLIFGSSVDKIKKESDIDLLVIGPSNMNKIIHEFEEIYNKKIHKVQINNLNKLNETLIREIYKKHLILNNTEQIVRFFGEEYEKNKLV